jgi:hypothetical protein
MKKRYSLFALVMLCGLMAAGSGFAQRNPEAGRPDAHLRRFLQKYLADPQSGPDKATRISSALVDLNGDGTMEAIVYVTGGGWCGSGGCRLLVLEPHGSSYRVIAHMTIVWPPIRVFDNETKGWRDLGVWQQGGGTLRGYEAVLPFNGKRYPENPSVPPARKATGRMKGETLPLTLDGMLLYSETPECRCNTA